jgi:hypothetical protein
VTDSPPEWTDHDVSDPGVTLLQLVVYAVGAITLASAAAVILRKRRRAGSPASD